MRVALVACLVLVLMPAYCCAADNGSDRLHGPIDFLRHALIQSADDGRFISAASRQLAAGQHDAAFQALLRVFSSPHDSFMPIVGEKDAGSTYQTALDLLRNANGTTRAKWVKSVEPIAKEELKRVIAEGKFKELRSVSRRFPLTPTALKAITSQIAFASSVGQHDLAEALLRQVSSDYSGPFVSRNARETIAALAKRVTEARGTSDGAKYSALAGTTKGFSPYELTLPAVQPLWQWRESVWEYPEAAMAMGGLLLPENRSLLPLNSWQSVLQNDQIILRTPARIVAFDKLSGDVLWTLNTDTQFQERTITTNDPLSAGGRASVRSLLQMDDIGNIAVGTNSFYFLDHVRRFSTAASSLRGTGLELPSGGDISFSVDQATKGATRLVAVRDGERPQIAWTVGEESDFRYEFQHNGEARSGQPINEHRSDSTDSVNPFEGQHFLGVPLVHQRRLYILSADREEIWLNCLNESSGRRLWRRPLLYREEPATSRRRSRYLSIPQEQNGASICGVHGNLIVSVVRTGIVIGTDAATGDLVWATNLRDDLNGKNSFSVPTSLAALTDGRETAPGPPVLSNGRLFWIAPGSSTVHCVNTQTGEVLWKILRGVTGSGILEGSRDITVVGVYGNQVIVQGDRHIRSLGVDDGTQGWVAPAGRPSGRAVANNTACLIPQTDGSLLSVDVQSGQQNVLSSDVIGSDHSVTGNLHVDNEVVCISTPLSLTVLPTFRSIVASPSRQNDDSTRLQAARRDILAGQFSNAIDQLQSIRKTASDAVIRDQATQLLTRLLLRAMDTEAPNLLRSAVTRDFARSVLNTLPLSLEQQLRLLILTEENQELARLQKTIEELPLLKLAPDRRVRSDVAALLNIAGARMSQFLRASDTADDQLQQVELATISPELIGDIAEQKRFADRLISSQRYAAAEMFLLAATNANTIDTSPLREMLQTLRAQSGWSRPTTPEDRAKPFRILPPDDVEFTEKTTLTTDSRIAEVVAAAQTSVSVPEWSPDRLFLVNKDLFCVNMHTGAVSPPFRMPASIIATAVKKDQAMPGFIPIVYKDHAGAVSLIAPGGPRLLWWRRLPRKLTDLSPLEVGPVGSSYFIVGTGTQIRCLHPLTGRTLWERDIVAASEIRDLFERPTRFFGDDQVLGLLGKHKQSCDVLQMTDGRSLATMALNVAAGNRPLISGRRILYPQNEKLILNDLLTGRDELSNVSIAVTTRTRAEMLPDGRAIVLSDNHEILILNLNTGQEEFRYDASKLLETQQPVGIRAFVRDDQLFVLLKDYDRPGSHLTASSRMGEPRLDSGTLLCVNRQTMKVDWHARMVPSVCPVIYGDPADVILTWSWHDPGSFAWQRGSGSTGNRVDNTRSLVLRLIDRKSGKVIAEEDGFSPAEPLRVVNDAGKGTIYVYTDKSEIAVRYAVPQ